MKLKLLLIFFSALLLTSARAQMDQTLRVEIEAKISKDDYQIVPIGEKGLLLISQTGSAKNSKWEISKYNTEFEEVWTTDFNTKGYISYKRAYFDSTEQKMYLLLTPNKTFSTEGNLYQDKGKYIIAEVDIDNGDIHRTEGEVKSSYMIKDFKVVETRAFMMGINLASPIHMCGQLCYNCTLIPGFTGKTVFKFTPVLINVDLSNAKSRQIPVSFPGNTHYINSIITTDKNIEITLRNIDPAQNTSLLLYTYSPAGDLISKTQLKNKKGITLISSKRKELASGNNLLMGTYAELAKKKFRFNPANNESMGLSTSAKGMYISKLDNDEPEFINYYKFSDFKSFYDLYTDKKAKKIKKKKAKAKRKGKDLNIEFNLLLHDIIEDDGEYIMIAEAYYPDYRYETHTTTDANGNMSTHTEKIFIGFRYSHAIIAAFDTDGEKLWDQSFQIFDILSFNLNEKIRVFYDKDSKDITLIYSYNGRLKSKIINQGDEISEKVSEKIETNYKEDKVKDSYSSDMEYWYDNYFISWGYQKIKNKNQKKKGKKKNRTVFYFNKIEY